MAVKLPLPDPAQLHPVAGLRLGAASAAIKKGSVPGQRKDLLVIELDPGAQVAGVFTQNRFCAAPVLVCREHLAAVEASGQAIRALVVNTGNANAGTGASGLAHARETCAALAAQLGVAPEQILPFSTGVILEPLPIDRLIAGLPAALAQRAPDRWFEAAQAIMTTDTQPKAASRRVQIDGVTVTLTGISKGAGMIKPNMATMLGYVATDARVSRAVLAQLTREAADLSFNCITVDGDTSTNDSFIVIATGAAAMPEIDSTDGPAYRALREALVDLSQTLAQMIVRDGEGATKFITVAVEDGASAAECRQVAYAIAHSPLVKTAFFASDPNLGRILAAIGYAGVADLDVGRVRLWLDDVLVARDGGRDPDYREEDGQRVMRQAEITIRVSLGRGAAAQTIWTTDLSTDYVKINADYRS